MILKAVLVSLTIAARDLPSPTISSEHTRAVQSSTVLYDLSRGIDLFHLDPYGYIDVIKVKLKT